MFSGYISFIKSIFSYCGSRLITAIILMLLLSFADGAGIGLLLPLIDYFTKNNSETFSLQDKYPLLNFLPASFSNAYFLIILFSGIALCYTLLKFFQNKNVNVLSFSFGNSLRQEVYRSLVNSNWSFIQKSRNSSYAEMLINNINKITSAVRQSVSMLGTFLVVTVNIILSIIISPKVSVLFIVLIPLILIFRKFLFVKFYEEGTRHKNHSQQYTGLVMEHLLGMKLAKSFNAEEKHQNDFNRISSTIEQSNQTIFSMQAKSALQMELLSVVIIFGILLFIASRQLTITPEWMVLLLIYIRLFPRLNSISKNFQTIIHTLPLFQQVRIFLEKSKEEIETKKFGDKKINSVEKGITFSNVGFRYINREILFDNFSSFFPAKKVIVIAGESGIGKSTLADMLLGLMLPQQGKILIDDSDIKDIDIKSWREKVGYVAQDSFFFFGTLKENLLWGNPAASNGQINNVLKQTALDDWIMQLPDGLNTLIGEQGIQISGGEKQRLALARALLRNPELLILDEFTSSLDEENEKIILSHLAEWRQKMTIAIITHKPIFNAMADKKIDMG